MKKNIKITMLLIALISAAVLGVVLTLFIVNNNNEFEKNLTVSENGTLSDTLEMKGLGLFPGSSRDFVVNVKGSDKGTYAFTLTFRDKNSGLLSEYISVDITMGNKKFSYRLSELFDGKIVEGSALLKSNEKSKLIIRYTMDEHAGNETQNATADFDILLQVRQLQD